MRPGPRKINSGIDSGINSGINSGIDSGIDSAAAFFSGAEPSEFRAGRRLDFGQRARDCGLGGMEKQRRKMLGRRRRGGRRGEMITLRPAPCAATSIPPGPRGLVGLATRAAMMRPKTAPAVCRSHSHPTKSGSSGRDAIMSKVYSKSTGRLAWARAAENTSLLSATFWPIYGRPYPRQRAR